MNEYQVKDEKGRDIFKKFCNQQQWCKHHKDSADEYASWDLSYYSGKTQMIGEIKYRTKYDGSAFEDWLLEIDKLVALKKIHKEVVAKGLNPLITYINHFNNNYTLIWDITDLQLKDYKIFKKLLPRNDFDDTLVWKDVIYLPRHQAAFKGETDKEFSIFKRDEDNYNDNDNLPF